MDGSSFTVVGVMPEHLRLLFPVEANIEANMQIWIPRQQPLNRLRRGLYFLRTLGRLRPESEWGQAQREMEEITRRIVPGKPEYTASGRSFYVVPLQADATRQLRSPLLAVTGGIALLILLACSNVAHLIVGRTLRRHSEFALRTALGASRLRVLRQLLTEGALLGISGGLGGILVARLGIHLFPILKPASLAHFESFELSRLALVLALLLTLATTLIFSLLPLLEVWPAESVIGKLIHVDFMTERGLQAVWARIVGVVSHIRHRELTGVVREQVYVPFRQSPRNPLAFILSFKGNQNEALTSALRREIAQVDPKLAPYDFRRLSDYVSSATSSQRFTTQLATVFSFNALLLAAIGIYGVVSYSVRQRLREVGIRLSLGARPFQIQALLTRSVLQWSVLGLGLGLGLSFLSGSVLEELLFGISPIDFPTYLLAGLILIGVGLAASWMPTRKALRISLIEILRTE